METVEKRIARVQKKVKQQKKDPALDENVSDDEAETEDEENQGMTANDEKDYFDVVIDATRKKGKGKRGGVDDDDNNGQSSLMFSQLNLSRPFLRAIEAMGYVEPTPIQAQVIPYGLAGRDICGSAVTGSGKTAAFALPFLERLLYRPKDIPAIRVLVITPTRELAMQIHEVIIKLSQFTDISSCLVCGGKRDVKSQEATLRSQPDIVICTPGRMLDHLRNSRSITLDDLDVLVLDEVDRLLELGFQEEVEELVKYCPIARQTMLFSATMTPKVEDLIKLSLKKPIRIKTESSNSTVAPRLIQEFIKVRDASVASSSGSNEIEALLLSLVSRGFGEKTIVFFELKRQAHRFTAICKLAGLKATELHGDMPQTMRYLSLEMFRTGESAILCSTDVAARGLDIPGVQTVINAEMPRNVSTYVHRVGRTARAGCGGRSITLVADDRRKIMKEVLKSEAKKVVDSNGNTVHQTNNQILSRTVPSGVLATYAAKITSFEDQIASFLEEEKQRMKLEALTRDTERAENLLAHADEIQSRPARTWFQSKAEKAELRELTLQKVREERAKAKELSIEEEKERERNMSASDKQAKMLLTDDYRLDDKENEKKLKNSVHRLSRVKRRRQEALAAEKEEQEEREKDGKGKGPSMDSVIKKAKSAARQKEESKRERSAGEITMKKVTVVEKLNDDGDDDGPTRKRTKIVRQKFAVGGFDHDMAEWSGSSGGINRVNKKAMKQQAKRDLEFEEFDPEKKLRKGGKKGHQSFKSKAKFKRRK